MVFSTGAGDSPVAPATGVGAVHLAAVGVVSEVIPFEMRISFKKFQKGGG